jgi:hypothetical protein
MHSMVGNTDYEHATAVGHEMQSVQNSITRLILIKFAMGSVLVGIILVYGGAIASVRLA